MNLFFVMMMMLKLECCWWRTQGCLMLAPQRAQDWADCKQDRRKEVFIARLYHPGETRMRLSISTFEFRFFFCYFYFVDFQDSLPTPLLVNTKYDHQMYKHSRPSCLFASWHLPLTPSECLETIQQAPPKATALVNLVLLGDKHLKPVRPHND